MSYLSTAGHQGLLRPDLSQILGYKPPRLLERVFWRTVSREFLLLIVYC